MSENKDFVWRGSIKLILILASILLLLFYTFSDGLNHMRGYWDTREEYGHGYVIPFLAVFFLYGRRKIYWKRSNFLDPGSALQL